MKSLVIAAPAELRNNITAALCAAGAEEPVMVADYLAAKPLLCEASFVLLVSAKCEGAELNFCGPAASLANRACCSPPLPMLLGRRRRSKQPGASCCPRRFPAKSLRWAYALRESISHKFSALETKTNSCASVWRILKL